MERNKLQVVRFERARHGANFLLTGVLEMTARTENLDALESRSRHLAEEFGRQFVRYEQVGRE